MTEVQPVLDVNGDPLEDGKWYWAKDIRGNWLCGMYSTTWKPMIRFVMGGYFIDLGSELGKDLVEFHLAALPEQTQQLIEDLDKLADVHNKMCGAKDKYIKELEQEIELLKKQNSGLLGRLDFWQDLAKDVM